MILKEKTINWKKTEIFVDCGVRKLGILDRNLGIFGKGEILNILVAAL